MTINDNNGEPDEALSDEAYDKLPGERDLIDERAARIPELVTRLMASGDGPDELYDTLRNTAGSLWIVVTYLEGQLL
jgi:hypothetical protein